MDMTALLKTFDITSDSAGTLPVYSPIDGAQIATIISAFNFPVAVWAWNAALALVCGNALLWKPSEKTPVTALACQALFDRHAC